MKALTAIGLLLVAALMNPTASLALEARGIRHAIPCFMCAPDVVEAWHLTRSTSTATVIINANIYDASGIRVGNFVIVDQGGTFLARLISFPTSLALAQATPVPLPVALYSAVLFESTQATEIFYEQIGLNALGSVGILTGRGTGPTAVPYGYKTGAERVRALTIAPEGPPFGTSNFFVCNNPANDMAAFLAVPALVLGSIGIAQFIDNNGNIAVSNFPTQSTFARSLLQLSPGGALGGSLELLPIGGSVMSCVRFLRIAGAPTLAAYTY
jgi:hypothetical protein